VLSDVQGVEKFGPDEPLEALLQPCSFQDGASHLLLIVPDRHPNIQRQLVNGAVTSHQPERTAVVALKYQPKGPFSAYCHAQGIALLRMPGPFELRFFLDRMSRLSAAPSQSAEELLPPAAKQDPYTRYETGLDQMLKELSQGHPRSRDLLAFESRLRENIDRARTYDDNENLRSERNEIIARLNDLALITLKLSFNSLCRPRGQVSARSVSGDAAAGGRAILLVTNSFDPDTEASQCLVAARLFDLILNEAPPDGNLSVHLAIECQSLCGMIDAMEAVHAWIFFGPADGSQGLREAHPPRFISPEGWRACFKGRDKDLSLALFIAGSSLEAARHFAGSGVACAVGFEGEDIHEGLGHSVSRLVRAVLREHADCFSLAEVLRDISHFLETTGSGDSRPQVFCPGRP
jgi:hypothetical protein